MRTSTAVAVIALAIFGSSGPANAQLGGILGGARDLLGHILPVPHYRHHRPAPHAVAPRAAAPQPQAVAPQPQTRDSAAAQSAPQPNSASIATQSTFASLAAWPTAYQDVVGFALWPDDYGPRVRDRGFDVIANTILARRQRAETTGSAGNTLNGDGCGAAVDANWPSDRLQQSSDPAQAEDVNRLQAVVAQSAQNIGAACKKASTAPERLNSLISTLWAVRDGGNGIREPVKTLVADAKPTNVASDAAPAANANADPGQQQAAPAPDANADQNRQQACGGANIGASERMVREIEQRVRPNERQRPALEGLRTASTDMAKLLMASCMQPVAPTPLARLDAADDQLATLNYAALTVRIALNQLYASLDNGQKARLNAAAP